MALCVKLLALGLGASLAALSLSLQIQPLVIHNRSPSAPVGFYVRTLGPPGLGDFVTLSVPAPARAYAATRGFGDDSDRFLKRVAASAGQAVCAAEDGVTVGDTLEVRRATHDSVGRELPRWSGCIILGEDQVFLLGDGSDSFDGRYWGPTEIREIDGTWRFIGK